MFDSSDFASRIANLEKSVQAVGVGRQSYLSSAVSTALGRGTGGSSHNFHVSFQGLSSSTSSTKSPPTANFGRNTDQDDQGDGEYREGGIRVAPGGNAPKSFYDPYAVPSGSAMRKPGASYAPEHHGASLYGPVDGVDPMESPTTTIAGGGDGGGGYFEVDRDSEAYAVCPRCAHLSNLEESLASVEMQYRNELEYLRRMIGQVDADRLDVVQRLRVTRDDLESARAQSMERERQSQEWRQRALMAEEQLVVEQRIYEGNTMDMTRRLKFGFEQMVMSQLTSETETRTEILASEQTVRSALWSQIAADRTLCLRSAQLAKLRRDEELLLHREKALRDAEVELNSLLVTGAKSLHPQPRDTSATSAAGQARLHLSKAGSSAAMASKSSSGVHDATAGASRSKAGGMPSDRGGAPQQHSLSDLPRVTSTNLLALDETPFGFDTPQAVPRAQQGTGGGGGGGGGTSEDMSFGDLDIDEDVFRSNSAPPAAVAQLPTPAAASHSHEAVEQPCAATDSVDITRRLQHLLLESESIRRQLEGQLLTERHYSNALQAEVDESALREIPTHETASRHSVQVWELSYRLDYLTQFHRSMPASAQRSAAKKADTARTDDDDEAQHQISLLKKELSVLRRLYTEAKEEASTSRKELQDLQLVVGSDLSKVEQRGSNEPNGAELRGGTRVAGGETDSARGRPLSQADVDTVAAAIESRMQPSLASIHSFLQQIARQLSVEENTTPSATNPPPAPEQPTVPSAALTAQGDVVEVGAGKCGTAPLASGDSEDTSRGIPSFVPVTSASRRSSSSGGFAALLLERVQAAARLTEEHLKNALETSLRDTDAKITELTAQVRSLSAPPSMNSTLVHTTPPSASISGAPVQPQQSSETSGSHTPVPQLPERAGTPSQSSARGGASAVISAPGTPSARNVSATGESSVMAASATAAVDPLSLSKLHDALASMRNIMRNVLFATSHNQKLLGEKLDEISIAQKSMMSELVAVSNSASSSHVLLGPPAGSSGFFSPTTGSGHSPHSPPAQASVGSVGNTHHTVAHGETNAMMQYSFPPALQLGGTAATVTANANGAQLSSPPSAPLPMFPPRGMVSPTKHSSQSADAAGGTVAASLALPSAAVAGHPIANSGGSDLRRRASHRWDEEEDDEEGTELPKRRATSATQSAQSTPGGTSRWHKRPKNPYEDEQDD